MNDVRVLLANDALLTKASSCFHDYATDQFTTVKVGTDDCLIAKEASLDGSKSFYDPKVSRSFSYNYLKNEASDIEEVGRNEGAEKWRLGVEKELGAYLNETYPNHVTAVFGKVDGGEVILNIYIEDHQYNPNNFWNGKWRSSWTVSCSTDGGFGKISGVIKVQVHYYEDGNVQLISSKEDTDSIKMDNVEDGAKNIVEFIKKRETDYQTAINENYRTMSDTTFKALRRNLPITHALIDWDKLPVFQVGRDMMNR